jgi:hypothetical protein
MRERLRGMSRGERRERSIQICENLRTFFPGKNSIALFAPEEIEPNLDLLWELGSLEHHLVSYPYCDGETLSFGTASVEAQGFTTDFFQRFPGTRLKWVFALHFSSSSKFRSNVTT